MEINVSEQDVGKSTGKNGRNIAALRSIVFSVAKGRIHYTIDVVSENAWKSQEGISKGKIRRLFEDRGYGFIQVDDGETIFFHVSSLQGVERRSLSLNQPVEFEIEEGPKGIRAVRVVPITGKDFQSPFS